MKQPHQVYRLTIDSLPATQKIEAEFEVVLAQLAAFTPTPELLCAIKEEMINRIIRRHINFHISIEPIVIGIDGKHCMTSGIDIQKNSIGMTIDDWSKNQRNE